MRKAGYPRSLLWSGIAIGSGVLAALAGIYAQNHEAGEMMLMENGPIESLQTVVLCLAVLIYALRIFKSADGVAAACISVAFILILAVLRETPSCGSAFYEGGICLSRSGKYGISGIAFLGALALAFMRRRHILEALRPRTFMLFWPLVLAAAMLAGADWAEHAHHQGIEEFLELTAYLYTMAHSIWLLRKT